MKRNLILLLLFIVTAIAANGQSFVIRGKVLDSLANPLAGASVTLFVGRDSLQTATDKTGGFSLSLKQRSSFQLSVQAIGYQLYRRSYNSSTKISSYELPAIKLRGKTNVLEAIEVTGIRPIRVMRDTVEYNAAAYVVREHGKLEDLLKQLPGLEVDAKGQVTSEGESMTKLRVNGEDFFTNNVGDFLRSLPANIIAKLQVIDDYGDQANFTGVKVGKPQKMLNLVIKEGKSRGVFGNIGGDAGTRKQYGANAQANFWLEKHQLGAQGDIRQNPVSGGKENSSFIGINQRFQANKILNVSSSYNFRSGGGHNEQQQYTESLLGSGSLLENTLQRSEQSNNSHDLNMNLQRQSGKNFIRFTIGASRSDSDTEGNNSSEQRGIAMQDLAQRNEGESRNQRGHLSANWSRLMIKPGRSLSADIALDGNSADNSNSMRDEMRYYDKETGEPIKDSLSLRQQLSERSATNLRFAISYNEPIRQRDSLGAGTGFSVKYNFGLSRDANAQEAFIGDELERRRLDSLSREFVSNLYTHQMELNYRADSRKLRYNIGLRMLPSFLEGSYVDTQQSTNYRMLNLLPIANVDYSGPKGMSVRMGYQGSVAAPAIAQLMPLPDVQNMQNIVVGNPDLKPALRHGVSLSFSRYASGKGWGYQLSANGGVTSNAIVSNVLTMVDTLSGIRRETRYVNADGTSNYGVDGSLTIPFAKHYEFNLGNRLSWSRTVAYVDGISGINSSSAWSPTAGLAANTQKVSLDLNLGYTQTETKYSIGKGIGSSPRIWHMGMSCRYNVSSRLLLSANSNYRITRGYFIRTKDPISLSANVQLFLFKRKILSLNLQAYDLLDQAQNNYQTSEGNTITQRLSSPIGRHFSLGAKLDLARFGG